MDAICPYLAFETLTALQEDGHIPPNMAQEKMRDNYIKVRLVDCFLCGILCLS